MRWQDRSSIRIAAIAILVVLTSFAGLSQAAWTSAPDAVMTVDIDSLNSGSMTGKVPLGVLLHNGSVLFPVQHFL